MWAVGQQKVRLHSRVTCRCDAGLHEVGTCVTPSIQRKLNKLGSASQRVGPSHVALMLLADTATAEDVPVCARLGFAKLVPALAILMGPELRSALRICVGADWASLR